MNKSRLKLSVWPSIKVKWTHFCGPYLFGPGRVDYFSGPHVFPILKCCYPPPGYPFHFAFPPLSSCCLLFSASLHSSLIPGMWSHLTGILPGIQNTWSTNTLQYVGRHPFGKVRDRGHSPCPPTLSCIGVLCLSFSSPLQHLWLGPQWCSSDSCSQVPGFLSWLDDTASWEKIFCLSVIIYVLITWPQYACSCLGLCVCLF